MPKNNVNGQGFAHLHMDSQNSASSKKVIKLPTTNPNFHLIRFCIVAFILITNRQEEFYNNIENKKSLPHIELYRNDKKYSRNNKLEISNFVVGTRFISKGRYNIVTQS